ncbi:MAG: hypothetical protein ACYS22_05300 [Planctomycetota bacterium]
MLLRIGFNLAVVFSVSLPLLACAGDSSGGSSGGTTATTPGGTTTGGTSTTGGSVTNAAHYQTALAALGQAPVGNDPNYFSAQGLSAYSNVLALSWPHFLPLVKAEVDNALRTRVVGQSVGAISIQGIRNLDIAIAPPPALFATAPGALQNLTIAVPAPPSTWRIRATIDMGGTVNVSVLGLAISSPITFAVDVEVTDIAITQSVDVDLSQPNHMQVVSVGQPAMNLKINLSSPSPILSTIAPALSGILDPIIRVALFASTGWVQQQIGLALQGLPTSNGWGHGAPPLPQLANPIALEPLTEDFLQRVRNEHLPFGMLYSVDYDSSVAGQGNIVGYSDHGDSPIWTGFYVCNETYRYDMIADPAAVTSVAKVLDALEILLNVSGKPGLLARAAIPSSSPLSAAVNGRDFFVGNYNGISYQAISNISRDQYLGTVLGLGQVMQRMPQLRGRAGALAALAVDHLDGSDWVAYRVSQPDVMTAPFFQSPSAMVNFTKVAALHDPARYGALARSFEPLADMMWFGSWGSSLEVHESYYKFNLGHANHLSLFELETNPTLYRAYLRAQSTMRAAVGHHQNAWFDVVHAIAIPTQAAQMAPDIQNLLEHAALRSRRGTPVFNSQDPNVTVASYVLTAPNASGSPGSTVTTQPRAIQVALHPIAPENRSASNFFWQRSPFELDSGAHLTREYAGTEVGLPFWAARNHGILP